MFNKPVQRITFFIADVVIINPCNWFNSVMVLHFSNKVRRYYMTRLKIWKVFGVYYIIRLDLTNQYKTTLCFARPKESFRISITLCKFNGH